MSKNKSTTPTATPTSAPQKQVTRLLRSAGLCGEVNDDLVACILPHDGHDRHGWTVERLVQLFCDNAKCSNFNGWIRRRSSDRASYGCDVCFQPMVRR